MNSGLTSLSDIEEVWRGDFDYAYQHANEAVYALTMHPQVRRRVSSDVHALSGRCGIHAKE